MATTRPHNQHRATATILAALRYWQEDYLTNAADKDGHIDLIDVSGHFDNDDPLTSNAIDVLCEHLNNGGLAAADSIMLSEERLAKVMSTLIFIASTCLDEAGMKQFRERMATAQAAGELA